MPRAIIFDVYRTLLTVGAAPVDAGLRWRQLSEELTGAPPPISHREFLAASEQVVARHHAQARARGIPWPEVLWPAIVAETLPGLKDLPPAAFDDFVFREIQLRRSLRLADGASRCLRWLRDNHVLLGIASNAQPYTLREFKSVLRGEGLDFSWFEQDLRFWSFEHGFSKPDPHVFRILTARLEIRGISPPDILMVGDRVENDIEPALAQGWQAWHLRDLPSPAPRGGSFHDLLAALA